VTEPWRPFQAGDDPLAQRYMTPEQVADLLARARASTRPECIETGRKNRARWDRWRAAQGR